MSKSSSYPSKLKSIVDRLAGAQGAQVAKEIAAPPSRAAVTAIIDTIKSVLFPGFFSEDNAIRTRSYFIGLNVDLLHSLLTRQIARALQYTGADPGADMSERAEALSLDFLESLPVIKDMLETDIQAISDNDPAVGSYGEVVACYPVVQAMTHYRAAHRLLELGVPLLPRIITELAHSTTGIDIHPGASIGRYFAIDHGTGVVIGETCIIGEHVTLYQGVTLGAKNFTLDEGGRPMNIARHPILEDHVTVYSNSTILGRVTIGHHSVIGGNVWLTHDVAPHTRIVQGKAETTDE